MEAAVNGWTCPFCRALVTDELHHCALMNQGRQQMQARSEERQAQQPSRPPSAGWTPHLCPVCEGRGKLQYNPANPFNAGTWSAGSTVPVWICHACKGAGVLWG